MSDEFATVVLKELRDFRTETNKRFDNLEEKVDVLQKLSDKHTEAINGLKKETKEHTRAIGELQETTEKMKEEIAENTNEINELQLVTKKLQLAVNENTKDIKELKLIIAQNSSDIKELQKIAQENSNGIKELKQEREKDKKSILDVLEAMDKSISKSFEDLREELDIKFERINIFQAIQQLQNIEVNRKLKLNTERMKLYNMRITILEEWKNNFENEPDVCLPMASEEDKDVRRSFWTMRANGILAKGVRDNPYVFFEQFCNAFKQNKIDRCGFLYELNGKDETFEEQFLSDGENGFMSRYALLYLISKTTNEKFLILLDEPETHFNEHWKRYFLKLLCDVLAQKDTDVFVATHSAMLVSDVKKHELHRFELNDNEIISNDCLLNSYGANIIDIGQILFKMEGNIGERAKDEIEKLLNSNSKKDIENVYYLIQGGGGPDSSGGNLRSSGYV